MKVAYSWLKEYVALAAPAELARQLTLAGLEVESLTPVAPPFSGVVVGEVLESGRHPDAEKLSLCQVTTDGENRLQIICGASNVRAGLRVAVAMVGARLPGDVTIKRAKLRGLESHGMLCSARELGLGDEHEGIMELAASLPLNQDLRAALDLDDVTLEVNATPNRGDCMSVFGIARDHAAAQERRYLTAQVEATSIEKLALRLWNDWCLWPASGQESIWVTAFWNSPDNSNILAFYTSDGLYEKMASLALDDYTEPELAAKASAVASVMRP